MMDIAAWDGGRTREGVGADRLVMAAILYMETLPPPSSAEKEYMVMQQGITAGTVLAILMPILIALLCYASYYRNKNEEQADYHQAAIRSSGRRFLNVPARLSRTPSPKASSTITPSPKNSAATTPIGWVAPPPVPPRMTEYPLGHADSSGESYDGSTTLTSSDSGKNSVALSSRGRRGRRNRGESDIPQKFDGEYYTREPLDDKPVVFQNVLWGVEESPGKQSAV